MAFSLSFKLFWRELKSGQLNMMMLALILAITCVSGISLFTDRLEKALQLQTAEFLGGDIKFESNEELSQEDIIGIQEIDLNQTKMVLFASVIASETEMQFSSIKVVDNSYPLVGKVILEPSSINQHPNKGNVWLDRRLLDLLKTELGDKIAIGDADFTVSNVILSEPDRGSNNYAFAPKAIISIKDLPQTNIIQPGSRVRFSYLFTGLQEDLDDLNKLFEKIKQPGDRITRVDDNEGSLGRAVERSGNFFLLGSLLAVLMSALTIGISSQKFSRRHVSYVAILRSLGMSSVNLKLLYFYIFLWLSMFSLFLGLSAGWIIQNAFTNILKSYFPTELPLPGFEPIYVSCITVLLCLIGFVYPHITKLIQTSPLSILRRDQDTSLKKHYLYPFMALSSMFALLLVYTGQLVLSSILFLGIISASFLGVAIIMLLFGKRTQEGLGASGSLKLAWSELNRRKVSNSIQVLAFMTAIGMSLIAYTARTDLMLTWESSVPEDSPNNFAINITKEELIPIKDFMVSSGIEIKDFYPITSTKIERLSSSDLAEDLLIDRTFNMTWTKRLPENNLIKEGVWFDKSRQKGLSISDEISERYNLKVGDKVNVIVQDNEIETFIQSTRTVDWESFSPNFFVIGHPELFINSPATYITSFYVPENKTKTISKFISEFRTVSILSIDEIIKQVSIIIDQVSKALEVILGLTILSASFLAISTLQDGFNLRLHQAAILRTLGASNKLLQRSILLEFSFLGLLSGFLAALLAQGGIYFIETRVFEVVAKFHLDLWLIGPLAGLVFVSISSLILINSITKKSPKEILFES
jgi:putative ABC transport system permease protein